MNIRVSLNTLRIITDNESSADEPYLWLAYIRVEGRSLTVNVPVGSHGDLGSGSDDMETGDQQNIPSAIGRFDTSLSDTGVVAVIILGMEEDATKDAAAEAGRKAFAKKLEELLKQAIASAVPPNTEQITNELQLAIIKAIKDESVSLLSFMPITSLLDIGGIVDPDDFVGSAVVGPFTATQIRNAGTSGLAFSVDLTGQGEGRYRVSGNVRVTSLALYDAVWRPGNSGEVQHYAKTFAQYQTLYDTLWPQGLRLQLLNTYVLNGKVLYDAVWRPGNSGEVQHYAKTFAQYQTLYDTLWPQGLRLQLLNTYVLNGKVLYDAVWRPGNSGEVQHYAKTFAQYQALYDTLWPQGLRLQLLNTYVLNGKVLYDAVWRPGNSGEVQHYAKTFAQYQTLYDTLWPQGLRLQLLNTYVLNGKVLYDAVWRPGNSGEVQHYAKTFAQYQTLYDTLWPQGLRLRLLNTYEIR